jgi:hypothetical protein
MLGHSLATGELMETGVEYIFSLGLNTSASGISLVVYL